MSKAIVKEMELRRVFLEEYGSLSTIYLGGGTPSVLAKGQLSHIWEGIHRIFSLSPEVEITLEANPDDLSRDRLQFYKSLGVNRLSIGIQSFLPEELEWMNRSHSVRQALECVNEAQDLGIENISVDLIFGTPFTDREQWRSQLEIAIELGVYHLSLYALTVEEKTALSHWVSVDKIQLPEDSLAAQQFFDSHEILEAAGYKHYELSNYAIPGRISQHNSAYWAGIPYLGVGPSAHSFKPAYRTANIANNALYLKSLSEGKSPVDYEEHLGMEEQFHEYIMTQLRTAKGISASFIEEKFGRDFQEKNHDQLQQWIHQGYMFIEEGYHKLSPRGWWVSDGIIRSLF